MDFGNLIIDGVVDEGDIDEPAWDGSSSEEEEAQTNQQGQKRKLDDGSDCNDDGDDRDDDIQDNTGFDPSIEGSERGSDESKRQKVDVVGAAEEGQTVSTYDDITTAYQEGRISFEEYSSYLEPYLTSDQALEEAGVAAAGPSTSDGNSKSPQKKEKAIIGSRTKLSRTLQGLMGQAEGYVIDKKIPEAIEACRMVIRLEPKAYEPYKLLSDIYEKNNNILHAFQYGKMGAFLHRNDADEWIHLAELAEELDDTAGQTTCYREAVKVAKGPQSLFLYTKLIFLEQSLNERWRAVETLKRCCRHILTLNTVEFNGLYVRNSSQAAKMLFDMSKPQEAAEILANAFSLFPHDITSQEVNLLCELYMAQEKYREALGLLTEYCGVEITESPTGELTSLTLMNELPHDFTAKLIIILIHLGATDLYKAELDQLHSSSDPDEVADLYLDIAEALTSAGMLGDAKPLLEKAANSQLGQLEEAVWLKLGSCLNSLGELHAAVEAYNKALALERESNGAGGKHQSEARVTLLLLHQQLGQEEEAMRTLAGDDGVQCGAPDLQMYEKRCRDLHTDEKKEDFIKVGWHLLFGHYPRQFVDRYKSELMSIRLCHKKRKKGPGPISIPLRRAFVFPEEDPLSVEKVWDLFIKMAHTLEEKGEYTKLVTCVLLAGHLLEYKVTDEMAKELTLMRVVSFLMANEEYSKEVFDCIRTIICQEAASHSLSVRTLNLFSRVLQCSPHDIRYVRFCKRLLVRCPEAIGLELIMGQVSFKVNTYSKALAHYRAVERKQPESPLVALLMACCYMHQSTTKCCNQRPTLLAVSTACLQSYEKLRRPSQETHYNIGRAFHGVGALAMAEFYYQKALECPPECPAPSSTNLTSQQKSSSTFERDRTTTSELNVKPSMIVQETISHELPCTAVASSSAEIPDESAVTKQVPSNGGKDGESVGSEVDEVFDLTREIAHNLSLIYLTTDRKSKAHFLLKKYLTI